MEANSLWVPFGMLPPGVVPFAPILQAPVAIKTLHSVSHRNAEETSFRYFVRFHCSNVCPHMQKGDDATFKSCFIRMFWISTVENLAQIVAETTSLQSDCIFVRLLTFLFVRRKFFLSMIYNLKNIFDCTTSFIFYLQFKKWNKKSYSNRSQNILFISFATTINQI